MQSNPVRTTTPPGLTGVLLMTGLVLTSLLVIAIVLRNVLDFCIAQL
jgi:hypothetical protein